MSSCALDNMTLKVETTGKLDNLPGRGLTKIPSYSIENLAPAIVEVSCHSLNVSVSVSDD